MQKKLANNISLNYEIYVLYQIQLNRKTILNLLVNIQLILNSIEKSHSSNLVDVNWAGNQLTNKFYNYSILTEKNVKS